MRQIRTPRARSACERGLGARQRLDVAARHRGVERGLEPPVRLLRPRFVAAEHRAEDVDLRLAHRRAHVLEVRRAARRPSGSKPIPAERLDERPLDDAAVAARSCPPCRAPRVGSPAPLRSNVSAAMAGDSVMPRPPGPVTTTRPGSGTTRTQTDVVGGLRVDTRPSGAAPAAAVGRGSTPPARQQVLVRLLVDREVVRLVVDVGVADRQLAAGPLRDRAAAPATGPRPSACGRAARRPRAPRTPGSSAASRRRRSRW